MLKGILCYIHIVRVNIALTIFTIMKFCVRSSMWAMCVHPCEPCVFLHVSHVCSQPWSHFRWGASRPSLFCAWWGWWLGPRSSAWCLVLSTACPTSTSTSWTSRNTSWRTRPAGWTLSSASCTQTPSQPLVSATPQSPRVQLYNYQ